MANTMGDMLKHAQKIQARLAQVQEEAGKKTVEASAGGNMVTATVNGKLELVTLSIDPTVTAADDVDMLQDLIVAAVNEGIRQAQQMMSAEMSKVTGGFKIPGLTG